MKRFQCSYIAKDRPQSLEIWAKDPAEAACVAVEKLSDFDYRRMELSDEQGVIYFRQGPSRSNPAFRTFARTGRPYIVRAGAGAPPTAGASDSARHDIHRLAS